VDGIIVGWLKVRVSDPNSQVRGNMRLQELMFLTVGGGVLKTDGVIVEATSAGRRVVSRDWLCWCNQ
jgi:hypothetical protein